MGNEHTVYVQEILYTEAVRVGHYAAGDTTSTRKEGLCLLK